MRHGSKHLQKVVTSEDLQCPDCSYKGSNKYKLKDHIIRMHSSVKLKCQYCDKTYGLKYDLQKHVEVRMFTLFNTGRARLIRSHSSARFCFELSGNSN